MVVNAYGASCDGRFGAGASLLTLGPSFSDGGGYADYSGDQKLGWGEGNRAVLTWSNKLQIFIPNYKKTSNLLSIC